MPEYLATLTELSMFRMMLQKFSSSRALLKSRYTSRHCAVSRTIPMICEMFTWHMLLTNFTSAFLLVTVTSKCEGEKSLQIFELLNKFCNTRRPFQFWPYYSRPNNIYQNLFSEDGSEYFNTFLVHLPFQIRFQNCSLGCHQLIYFHCCPIQYNVQYFYPSWFSVVLPFG